MNTLATIVALMLAMISARVIAAGTDRFRRFAATVMPVNTSSAAPIIRYVRTLFLTASASTCIDNLHCGPEGPHYKRRPTRSAGLQACPALQQVQHREQENPNQIDEVPVEPGELDPVDELLGIPLPHPGARADEIRHHHHPAEDVDAVQARERVVDREIRAHPRTLAVREVVGVLEVLVDQEDTREQEREDQVQAVLPEVVQ